MAIYEKGNTYGKMGLRDGARGNKVDGRINRSNHTLNTAAHETTNIKYGLDDRLAVEFKYGYAAGYNQMIIPKGRVVAVDPYLQIFDADTQKMDNALTLANGGKTVTFNKTTGHWEAGGDFVVNTATGKATTNPETVRPGNIPIGIALRNEYTRDVDAFNGITPGAVNTDCMVELPYFITEEKAKATPWGSAYANALAGTALSLRPGDLVKADATGRVVLSPLSDIAEFFKTASSSNVADILKLYELERQQVIGQVYEVRRDLIPMGAAKYAQWALSDILEFEEFNPDVTRKTNRRGEDNIESTPYQTNGKAPFGFEKGLNESDLHMLGLGEKGSRTAYNKRMQHKYRFDFGIPGLTDGYNAVEKIYGPELAGTIIDAGEKTVGHVFTFKILNTNAVANSLVLNPTSVNEKTGAISGGKALTKTEVGTVIEGTKLKLVYLNELQGIVQFEVAEKLGTTITDEGPDKGKYTAAADLDITFAYKKKGEAGVPTHLDWDGCVGTVKILLQK